MSEAELAQGAPETPGADAPRPRRRESAVQARRHARQQEIVAATRTLFDARGMRDANIDDIARSVGINRTIIYRHVASKEELFALTLAEYLREIRDLIASTDDESQPPKQRLEVVGEKFALYCSTYPAFLDCAFALLRKPGEDLLAEIGDAALLQLGQLMGLLLGRISAIIQAGQQDGVFAPRDPDLAATAMYTQILGLMHIARLGFYVRESAPGVPQLVRVDDAQIQDLAVKAGVASVLAAAPDQQ